MSDDNKNGSLNSQKIRLPGNGPGKIEKLTKFQIASRQLETAIGLFVSNGDRLAAITLAGAADGILHGLVLREGKVPFSDYALAIGQAESSGPTPPKRAFAKHINDTLNINVLKHMDPGDPDFVELDVTESAIGAIVKAIANYKMLAEVKNEPSYIVAMLAWLWSHDDGKTMERYEGRSAKVKAVEKKLAAKKN